MADLKISQLPALAGSDLLAADQLAVADTSASETKRITVTDLVGNAVTLIADATIPGAKILFSAGGVAGTAIADGGVTTAKLAADSVTAAKLADESTVDLVTTLPGAGAFTGQIALDTDDSKIYVWNGSAWVSVKGAGSVNVVNGSTTGVVNITSTTSGDTCTIAATLDDTSAAAQFLGGPTGAGGTVGYRTIIGTDLPTPTTSAKGGVIVNGNGLAMSGDTLTIDNTVTAEASENHIVQYDANGLVTGGRVIAAADVPVATSSTVGVIKPGSGLGVDAAGQVSHNNSITAGTAAKVSFDTEGHITATEALAASDIPNLDASKITTGTLPEARIGSDAVTAAKLADRSTATIAETTPTGGAFIGQCHLNSITGDYFLWDGNVWQPIGISVGEIVLAGTYNATTNKVATVTSEGTALSFVVGSALPAASSANKGYYVVVSTAGTGTSPAPTVALNPPDFLLSTGTAYTEIDVSATVTAQQASNVAFTAAGNISATNVQAAIEELDTEKVAAANPTLTGTVALGEDAVITFEGATSNDFETTLTVVDPTADRTVSLPNVTGTLISTGDTGTVTSAMIVDGAIVNADISASAEIAVSKLANGTARQLLQTDTAGSGVEFTSNIDVPGTLDVTGAATLDSTLGVTGVISADGKVKFPAGSASAPSFYSGTDTNTGLYFSAADEVSVTTGGTQRVVVDSSGRVGIGTSSPSQKLHIRDSSGPLLTFDDATTQFGSLGSYNKLVGSGAVDTFLVSSANSKPLVLRAPTGQTISCDIGSSEALRIDSSGRLLIGLTSARTISSQTIPLQIEGSASGTGRFAIGNNNSGNASGPAIYFFRSRGGTLNSNTVVQSGDDLGTIFFNGADGSDVDSRAASIAAQVDGAPGSNDMPGRLVFSTTADGTSTPTERMRLDSSGRLLLDTTDAANAHADADDFIIGRTNKSESGMTIVTSNGGNGTINFSDGSSSQAQGQIQYYQGTNYMSFDTNASEAMRIDSSGRLLVGTTTLGSSGADDFTIATSGQTGITIRSGTTSGGQIHFSDGTSGADQERGIISYQHGGNYMRFYTDAVERLRIDSSGRVGIGTTSPVNIGAGYEGLTINGSTAATLYLQGGGTSGGRLLSDGSDLFIGPVQSNGNTIIQRSHGSYETARFDSSGRLLVGRTSSTGSGEEIQDSKGGIRSIPQNSKTSAYTLVVGDVGKHINITTGGVTVPASIFSVGDAVTIYNDSSSNQTVTQGSSVTLRSAGTADTGNRTLAQRGICTVLCVGSNEFVISGAGLS